ncbi:BolA/IbaG family iron-sulfur metabolism protein [Bermanella marisrubri]|nr:BolA/IbaG family iron-sulfur metabolism protein [Bermanella marisrubri]
MMIQETIEQKLNDQFSVKHLEIVNESHMHSVPANSETHFKVVLVADEFAGMNKVKQHQAIYAALKDELAGPVHALALHTFAPDTWQKQSVPDSPNCLGGNGK